MVDNEKSGFSYTYSAKEQQEIRSIRQKYTMPENREEDKMGQLRRLDASVTQKGTVLSLIAGILGALIFGAGISCILVWGELLAYLIGIPAGLSGLALAACAYPIYEKVTARERERVAPEILRLSEELLK